MLVPTHANRLSWLYAAGNTPATNLARSVPHGQDADILTLGCGDLRNILFTAYVDKGLVPRTLDITCCDIDEGIIGRNLILLTLIVDGAETATDAVLWDLYYHLYLDDPTAHLVLEQTERILPLLASIDAWSEGPYARFLKFCDGDTLDDVRRICQRVLDGARNRGDDGFQKAFTQHLELMADVREMFIGSRHCSSVSGMRSAAPLSLQSGTELPQASRQYWNQGTVTPSRAEARVPNPMFAGLISEDEVLHYGTDPIMGYHLATAFAPLSKKSPLKPDDGVPGFRAAAAAKAQFGEWVAAFRQALKQRIVLRLVVADVYAFCHTLQHAAASGRPSANWHRRQWDLKPLILDEGAYGKDKNARTTFDMIDTSNLSDHVGALNMLVATAPLLKQRPWATVYTELMIKRHDSQQETFDTLLCGPALTVSLLLGISPVQYWTNGKCESHVDEVFLGLMGKTASQKKETQLHIRLAWKRDDQFSGQLRGRSRLHVEAKAVSSLLFRIYRQMFKGESLEDGLAGLSSRTRNTVYTHFHRGSFAALLKLVSSRVKTNWPEACSHLIDTIAQDGTILLSSNQMQELCTQLHLQGVSTAPWLLNGVGSQPESGPLKEWRNIPPVVAVTLVVPREAFARLYTKSQQHRLASPTLVGSLKAGPTAVNPWHNMYADVHITFGNVKTKSAGEDSVIAVEEDKLRWQGSSPLIVSFVIPTASLLIQPTTAFIGLCVQPSTQSTMLYGPIIGMSMTVFETTIGDGARVFVSKFMPGHAAHRVVCGGVRPFEDTIGEESKDQTTMILAQIPASETRITTVTGRVTIASDRGKGLLRDKVPIELRQQGPFIINVVFGQGTLIYTLTFPVPVSQEGSKIRIARTSGYVEVIAPLADPVTSKSLSDFIYPALLSSSGLPVALNTPHVNLDNLPILDMDSKGEMNWLISLTSFQFSERERLLRKADDTKNGISDSPRVNFKDSLFSLFMLTSGLQGEQTALFAINHPQRGGIQMLILVSAMRLDGDAASVVLDAAVIPLTVELIMSGRMESFLLLMRTLKCCMLQVNDAELILWKRILPSLAERCRTWNHLPSCEYRHEGATVPLSVEPAAQVLCSCGNGRLPRGFVSIPQWDVAAPNAVRIAISPTYAVPYVENVIDESDLEVGDGRASQTEGCRRCGRPHGADGAPLKRCKGCMRASYCAAECQKSDWKRHRMECKKAE